jgi:peptidoglycan endopeptidase LytE
VPEVCYSNGNSMTHRKTAGQSGVLVAILGFLLLVVPACADTVYVVRSGDSICSIAERTGVDPDALLEANDLGCDDVIHPGQELVVPGTEAVDETSSDVPGSETAEVVYVVRRGDTLSEIARAYGVSVQTIVAANGVRNPNLIRVGRRLTIPGATEGANAGDGISADNPLVRSALQYRGVPYRYAGMTTRGMDCSGLVARVLGLHGIEAPHNSRAQYELGTSVPLDELQAGDLVFFHTTRPGISHVGIYIGDSQFIHASSGGGRVKVDRLDQGYYHSRLVGARRVE